MATGLSCFALVALMAIGSNAFFFSETPRPTARGDVDPDCIAAAQAGSCEFYQCFENRFECGRDWYILRHGLYYCNKIELEKPNFTPAGQTFLTRTTRCMTTALIEAYRGERVDCHALRHQAVASISSCYLNNSFCDIFNANAEHFGAIYEVRDLFTRGAAGIWREIASLASSCGSRALNTLTDTTGESISSLAQNALNSIRGIFHNNDNNNDNNNN